VGWRGWAGEVEWICSWLPVGLPPQARGRWGGRRSEETTESLPAWMTCHQPKEREEQGGREVAGVGPPNE
jgi:hypothetical protein